MTAETTATVPTWGTHCRTCTCPPPDTDSLCIYPPHEGFYGRCETCGEVRWATEIYPYHRGSPRKSKHCGCCTHPHDLEPGGRTIPHREYGADDQPRAGGPR